MTQAPNSHRLLLIRILYLLSIAVVVFVALALFLRYTDPPVRKEPVPLAAGNETPVRDLPLLPPPPGVEDSPILPSPGREQAVYESSKAADDVAAYYRKVLARGGWQEQSRYAARLAGATGMEVLAFWRQGILCEVHLDPLQERSGTAVFLRLVRREAEPDGKK